MSRCESPDEVFTPRSEAGSQSNWKWQCGSIQFGLEERIVLWLNQGQPTVGRGEGHRSTEVSLCNKVRLHTFARITQLQGLRLNIEYTLEIRFLLVLLRLNVLPFWLEWASDNNSRTVFAVLLHLYKKARNTRLLTGPFLFFAAPDTQVAQSQSSVKVFCDSAHNSVDEASPLFTCPVSPSLSLGKRPGFHSSRIVSLCYGMFGNASSGRLLVDRTAEGLHILGRKCRLIQMERWRILTGQNPFPSHPLLISKVQVLAGSFLYTYQSYLFYFFRRPTTGQQGKKGGADRQSLFHCSCNSDFYPLKKLSNCLFLSSGDIPQSYPPVVCAHLPLLDLLRPETIGQEHLLCICKNCGGKTSSWIFSYLVCAAMKDSLSAKHMGFSIALPVISSLMFSKGE